MRYPDPSLFARRVLLRLTPAGKPYAAYRKNPLNPSTVWGKPVPFCMAAYLTPDTGPVLVFDTFIAPLYAYACALEATQHLPIDTPHQDIHFIADPQERVWTLLDQNILRGAVHQDMMKHVLKLAMIKTYDKVKAEQPDALPDELVIEVANRMCRTRSLVRSTLTAASVHIPVQSKAPSKKAESKPHRFSSSYTFGRKYELLTAVIQQCRSSVVQRRHKTGTDEPCSFSLADLHDLNALGGYPLRCPVTGAELNWDEGMSWFSPRVGRYDPNGLFVSGNVVLMSKLGKRITEGNPVRNLSGLLESHAYIPTALAAWAAEHPVPASSATSLIRSSEKPVPVPLPPLPTLEEQRRRQQTVFEHQPLTDTAPIQVPKGITESVRKMLAEW